MALSHNPNLGGGVIWMDAQSELFLGLHLRLITGFAYIHVQVASHRKPMPQGCRRYIDNVETSDQIDRRTGWLDAEPVGRARGYSAPQPCHLPREALRETQYNLELDWGGISREHQRVILIDDGRLLCGIRVTPVSVIKPTKLCLAQPVSKKMAGDPPHFIRSRTPQPLQQIPGEDAMPLVAVFGNGLLNGLQRSTCGKRNECGTGRGSPPEMGVRGGGVGWVRTCRSIQQSSHSTHSRKYPAS